MKRYTQTNLSPGNCWQTAVACLLEVEPETLPPQVEIERWPSGALGGWKSYSNCLNGYLNKHHGLCYSEIQRYQMKCVLPLREYHLLIGPTVRTEQTRRNHVVVARNREPVWDVHPSRAGLIAVESWGLLGPIDYESEREWRARKGADTDYMLVFSCLCPTCGLEEARARVAAMPPAPADE